MFGPTRSECVSLAERESSTYCPLILRLRSPPISDVCTGKRDDNLTPSGTPPINRCPLDMAMFGVILTAPWWTPPLTVKRGLG